MADTRKSVQCAYCGASFHVKYDSDDLNQPEFCCFCSESFDDPEEEVEDDETDELDTDFDEEQTDD